MIKIEPDMSDLRAIKQKFSMLSDRVQSTVVRRVFHRAVRPLEKKMKQIAPVSRSGAVSKQYASRRHPPGYLRASIGTVLSKRGSRYPTVWVGPRFKVGGWDPWYAHFPMFGTKKIKHPKPFVDQAWDSMRAQIENTIYRELEGNLQAEIDKRK
jgi:HK97 gp10 family phage protein